MKYIKKCEDCKFWVLNTKTTAPGSYGFCHRYPPPPKDDTPPITKSDYWCGEFFHKDAKADE